MLTLLRTRSTWVIAASTILLQACGCETYACINGVQVKLASTPAAPFNVELLVAGVVQPAPADATCEAGQQCVTKFFFMTSARNNVTVRVTTPNGVRSTEFATVPYRDDKQPGGCATCRHADLTVLLP